MSDQVIELDGVRPVDELVRSALVMLDETMAANKIDRLIGLFSGGHDSLTTTHLVSQHPKFGGVIHINTGTGIPETGAFVRETCREHGWELHELHPTTNYLQLIVRYGFPGPAQHSMMYRMLKDRPLQNAIPKIKQHRLEKLGLCAGVRSQESTRRMGHVEPVRKDRTWFWLSPIHDWTAFEVSRYVNHFGLKRNAVKDRMHISGECLCGAFATEHERQEIALWYPHVDHELSKYEQVVQLAADLRVGEANIPALAREWGWGPKRDRTHKHPMQPDGDPREIVEEIENSMALPMCWYCHAGREGEAS